MPGKTDIEQNDQTVQRAINALQAGHPVCVHDFDDREGETDLIYPASGITAEAIARLRNDAGGLICVAVSDQVAKVADLPFLADIIDHPAAEMDTLAYGDRSTFSIPVNHKDTFTGITDQDRALTIQELGTYAEKAVEGLTDQTEFAENFRTPGHVHVLKAAPGLLSERQGHTELGIALAKAAGLSPAVVVCEMLDDETGEALSVQDAKSYAQSHNLVFLEGSKIVQTLR